MGLGTKGILGEMSSYPDVSLRWQDILNKAHQAPLYTYAMSLTQGIVLASSSWSNKEAIMIMCGGRKGFSLIMIVSTEFLKRIQYRF